MNQLTIGALVVLGGLCYFLYSQNETLKENNIKLENAVQAQQEAMIH